MFSFKIARNPPPYIFLVVTKGSDVIMSLLAYVTDLAAVYVLFFTLFEHFLSRTSQPHLLFFFKGIWNYLLPVASKRLNFPLFLASLQVYVPRLPFSAPSILLATQFLIISGALSAVPLRALHLNLSCLNSTKFLVFLHNGKTNKKLCQ